MVFFYVIDFYEYNKFNWVFFIALLTYCKAQNQERPNILRITCKDISLYLVCYGFEQAQTHNIDELSENGMLYSNA